MNSTVLKPSRRASALAAAISVATIAWATAATATTYTVNGDFDGGTLNSVHHDVPDQLQLSVTSATLPFMYLAQTSDGYVLKINTTTGKQVGRYLTTRLADCPSCPVNRTQWYPSRTAVDLNGDVWVANRSFSVQGSITKIASTVAGCIDRNGNGVIDTSNDANGDGIIDVNSAAEFFGQNDECIIKSIPVGGINTMLRALALDADGKVWVGGFTTKSAYRINPDTGVLMQTINLGTTPYGFVVKGKYLYSAALGQPVARADVTTGNVQRMSCNGNYGITVNSNGVAWFGKYSGGIGRADFDAPSSGCPVNGLCATTCTHFNGDTHSGITVDGSDQVWAAGSTQVQKYSSTGVLLGGASTSGGYGVAIGHDGSVWSAANNGAYRVLPGPVGGAPGVASAKFNTGVVGNPNTYNYTYSDFTGFQALNITTKQGTWSRIHDGGNAGTIWGTLSWNAEAQGSVPAGTLIKGEVRAAESQAALTTAAFVEVTNGNLFNLVGRFIEIKLTLRINDAGSAASPILSDVTIVPGNAAPTAACADRSVCNTAGTCEGSADVNNGSSDADGDAITLAYSPAGPYASGTTSVTLTVGDGQTTSTCSANVTINDCEAPAITASAAQTLECTGANGATASFTTSASDNCAVTSTTCTAESGSIFPIGTTTATCTAQDAAGLTTSASTTITIVDTTAPSITCPGAQAAECTGNSSASVTPAAASASDICGGVNVTNAAAGSFALGTTMVGYSATDDHGLTSTCEAAITVLDTTAPSITCPAPYTTECTGSSSAAVIPGAALASDICGGVTVQDALGAIFALGTTTVGYSATDAQGLTSTCTADITVVDTTAPSITCPAEVVAECTGNHSATVTPGAASASDICGGVTVANPAAASFPLGATTVGYSATDAQGLTSSCTADITVIDTTAPTITVAALGLGELWSPNHKYQTVSLADCGIAVQDTCDGELTLTGSSATITCVSSDELENSKGDGNTLKDIIIVDATRVQVRAERDGSLDGRVYNIGFEVKDQAGNVTSGICKVSVPHDQGPNGTAVDSGVKYMVCK